MKALRSNPKLGKVLGYIETNLDQPLDLDTLSEVSHWSRWQMQRVFKDNFGLSVAQYVRHLRLSQSASHLIASPTRHMDIALNAGFDSEVSFSRTFKAHFGCTPKEYRKRGTPTGIRFPLTNTAYNCVRLEKRPAFSIMGTYREAKGLFFMQPDIKKQAPIVWQNTKTLLHQHGGEHSRPFAVLDIGRHASKYITYWVGVEQLSGAPPAEFETLHVPEQLYAVVTHKGKLSGLIDTVAWFIAHWLLHSSYRAYSAYELEEYIEFDEEKDDFHIDYWVPIQPMGLMVNKDSSPVRHTNIQRNL